MSVLVSLVGKIKYTPLCSCVFLAPPSLKSDALLRLTCTTSRGQEEHSGGEDKGYGGPTLVAKWTAVQRPQDRPSEGSPSQAGGKRSWRAGKGDCSVAGPCLGCLSHPCSCSVMNERLWKCCASIIRDMSPHHQHAAQLRPGYAQALCVCTLTSGFHVMELGSELQPQTSRLHGQTSCFVRASLTQAVLLSTPSTRLSCRPREVSISTPPVMSASVSIYDLSFITLLSAASCWYCTHTFFFRVSIRPLSFLASVCSECLESIRMK